MNELRTKALFFTPLSLSIYIYMYKSEIDVGSNFELLLVVEADVIMGADYEIAFSLAK